MTRKKIILELDVYIEEFEAGEYTVSLLHPDLKGFLKFDSFDENEIESILNDIEYQVEPEEVVKEVVREVEVVKEVVKPYDQDANHVIAVAEGINGIKDLFRQLRQLK